LSNKEKTSNTVFKEITAKMIKDASAKKPVPQAQPKPKAK
jgi:hypothetical protein